MSISTAAFHRGKHLQAGEVYDAITRCPVCGSTAPRKRSITLQRDPHVYLLSCPVCRAYSSSHMPTETALNQYYESYYDRNADGVTFHGVENLGRHIFDSIVRDVDSMPQAVRVLDYGGGNGALSMNIARRLVRMGVATVEIHLIDYGHQKSIREQAITLSTLPNMSAVSDSYFIIVASAVLEHVPEFHQLIVQLSGALSTGGYFYARTPYAVPFKKLLPFMDFTYPAHVHDLGPEFWFRFPKTFGLNWTPVLQGPSPVQTQFSRAPLRTMAAALMKMPTRLEQKLRGRSFSHSLWPFPGGWEVVYRKVT